MEKKLIVISAVNLRKGGTLTILKDCLKYLSNLVKTNQYRVVAIVHKRELCDYTGIEYIEMPNVATSWIKRLWCEYVTMNRISKKLSPVYLWLSLHDTSPRVIAERQAVYCQTSFPFYKWKWRDFLMDYKIPLFSLFTKYAYRINVSANNYLIVQQKWFYNALSELLKVEKSKFLLFPPLIKKYEGEIEYVEKKKFLFLFVSTPDCHKSFETLCEAARLLEAEIGGDKFSVILTVKGDENRYAKWLYQHWGDVNSIDFMGFMSRKTLYAYYKISDCLVFPSKVETWGLPITEFMSVSNAKPMLLADLPYAYETSAGSKQVAFFNPEKPEELKVMMRKLIEGDSSFLKEVERKNLKEPKAENWEDLFKILLG